MRIGIPNELGDHETRVALTPAVLPALLRDGHEVLVEAGAGAGAHLADALYTAAGARVVDAAAALFAQTDVLFKVGALRMREGRQHEAAMLREGALCIGLLAPLAYPDTIATLACRGITSYALEYIPRISRAQGMDALTAMATIAGYKAVLLAADRLDRLFPLLMTAAGTIAPADVLVLGAGVAGLQAVATARRLGARVTAFDPRPAVREQVQSLGASFLEMATAENIQTAGGYAREQSAAYLQRERDAIAGHLPRADVVICTAQVFGQRAPLLITAEMLEAMRPGAVVVDLAADQGGNCALTQPGTEATHAGVLVVGAGNLPAQVPFDASQLYARTIVNFFRYLYPAKGPAPDSADEIVRAACITRDGAVVHEATRAAIEQVARQGAPV